MYSNRMSKTTTPFTVIPAKAGIHTTPPARMPRIRTELV